MRTFGSKHLLFHLILSTLTPLNYSITTPYSKTFHQAITSGYSQYSNTSKDSMQTSVDFSTTKQHTVHGNDTFFFQRNEPSLNSTYETDNILTTTMESKSVVTMSPKFTVGTNGIMTVITKYKSDAAISDVNTVSDIIKDTKFTSSQSMSPYVHTILTAVVVYPTTANEQTIESTSISLKQEATTNTGSSSNHLFQLDICAKYSNCNYVLNLTFQYCRCDDLCSMYNDCCFDLAVQNITSENNLSFECLSYSSSGRHDGIFVITRCPNNTDETEITRKCQISDLLTVGPWVLDNDGFVYQNRFCAECYGKTSIRVFSIKITNVWDQYLHRFVNNTSYLKLQELVTIMELSNSVQNPILEQVPPHGVRVRRCIKYGSTTEPVTKCPDYYISPMKPTLPYQNIIFKNQFCASSATRVFRCLGHNFKPNDLLRIDYDPFHDFFPLSIMFTFRRTDQECRNQVNGLCLVKEMYKDYEVTSKYVLTSTVLLSGLQRNQLLLLFAWIFPPDIKIGHFTKFGTEKINNSSFQSEFVIMLSIVRQMQAKDILDYETALKNIKCEILIRQPDGNAISVEINKTNKMDFVPFGIRTKLDLVPEMRKSKLNISVKKTDVCTHYFIECELLNDSSLLIKDLNCIKKFGRSIHVPTDLAKKKKTIITLTCLSVSVLALIVSLVIHRFSGMHRSIPGSNIENLSISLLLSNIVFLFGVGANDYRNVCYAVGVSLHYLWLSVFAFMSITLVNMFNKLRQMSVSTSNTQKSKTQIKFTIAGLLLPTVFVIPAVVLDYLEVFEFNPLYGGVICFPTGYPGTLIFVLSPIGLSVLVNVACFLGIAVVLTKHLINSKHLRKSSSYQNVFVYARISAVTGIFWITGILGVFLKAEIIDYVFITCCSLQGFFVALANLTTKRVIRQTKERLAV